MADYPVHGSLDWDDNLKAYIDDTDAGKASTASVTAVETALADHLADTSDAHDASAISYAGSAGISATNVESALDELDTEKETPAGAQAKVDTHVNDTSAAHAASAISYAGSTNLSATDVEAALDELDTEKASTGSVATVSTGLSDHLADTSDAHDASAISYAGSTNLSATDVEAALDELDAEKAPLTMSINTQTGTSYTLVLGDAGKFVTMSNAGASTLTVPPNSSVAFPVGTVIEGAQLGAGQVTLTPGSGVTLNGAPGLKIADQYGTFGLIKTDTDTWLAFGRLAA